MEHFYKNVPGMFNFQELYKIMVAEAPAEGHFVEVGTFLGKSAAFMAVEIMNSSKSITFDVVDTFKGSPGDEEHAEYVNSHTGDFYHKFLKNIKPAAGVIRPFPIPSLDAVKYYEDESLDFVYIDAAHDYESVKNDLQAWQPKVKTGGYIGGHDYRSNCPGVWKAVRQRFPIKRIRRIGTSFLVCKQ